MKNLVMFLGAVLLVGAAACSSSSSSGSSAGSCPSVGPGACPNDPAVTQADVDACNKCLSQSQAVVSCASTNGITVQTTSSCGSDGKSQPQQLTQDQLTTLESKCASQLQADSDCETGTTTTGDGGS